MIKRFTNSRAVKFEFDNGKTVRAMFIDNLVVVCGPGVVDEKMGADQFADYLTIVSNSLLLEEPS